MHQATLIIAFLGIVMHPACTLQIFAYLIATKHVALIFAGLALNIRRLWIGSICTTLLCIGFLRCPPHVLRHALEEDLHISDCKPTYTIALLRIGNTNEMMMQIASICQL